MVAEIWRERIRLPVRKDQRTEGVEESARDQQGDGSHPKLFVDGTDQENDDPTHQQETDIRQQGGNFGKENGLERDKENRQTPDDPEQNPACRAAEDGEAKGRVRPCDEDVDGVMIENSKDAQIFSEEQKEVQETTEKKGQKQTRPIDRKADNLSGFVVNGGQSHQHRQRRNGQDSADQVTDGVEVFIAVGRGDERVEEWFLHGWDNTLLRLMVTLVARRGRNHSLGCLSASRIRRRWIS
jgi:hypothetical protein